MNWDSLRGHDRQRTQFAQAVRRERTAHAYLFVGPEGIGKRRFARLLAQCLFCERIPNEQLDACGECAPCVQMQAGTHPDLIRIARPEGKRELPVELIIGSPDRRGREGLCHELALRPMTADRRIAIIDDAQTMNAASANALLKTLEEPPAGSILILLTPTVDAMLPTIRSRCQPVMFAPLPDEDVAALILQQQWAADEPTARETAQLAGGSLQTARQLLQPPLRKLRDHLFKILAQPALDPFAASTAVLAIIEELGGDSSTQRLHAGWAIRFCVESLRMRLRELSAADDSNALDTDPFLIDSLAAQLERCLDAEIHLQRSMPVPLCLEGMFDGLARIRRGVVPV